MIGMSMLPITMEASVSAISPLISSNQALHTSQIKNQDPLILLELIKLSEIMSGPIWSCIDKMARVETPIYLITTVASLSKRALTSSVDINRISKGHSGTIRRPSPGSANPSPPSPLYVTNQMLASSGILSIASRYIIDSGVKRRISKMASYARKVVLLRLKEIGLTVMLSQGRKRWDTIEHKAFK